MAGITLETLTEKLLTRTPPPLLLPQSVWDPELTPLIPDVAKTAASPLLAEAGLHLWNDDLESCHALAQTEESSLSCYWHGLMHRREGDFTNAGYWFRRVGSPSFWKKMQADFADWDPFVFLGWCR